MIPSQVEKNLHSAIKLYNNKSGKEYLVAFSEGINQPLSEINIKFEKDNFWHLLGCEKDKNFEVQDLYAFCLKEESIYNKFNYSSGSSLRSCNEKYEIFSNVFDFIKNGKQLRISSTINTPEEYTFDFGVGSSVGIIGYAPDSSNDYYFPKTTRSRDVMSISKKPNKLVFVLSKNIDSNKYNKLEFEIAKDAFVKSYEKLSDSTTVKINKDSLSIIRS